MRGVSLFSGCGGLDLGLELAGHEIVLAVENDPAASKIHAARFPHVPNLGDVEAADWNEIGEWLDVDFLAAGFPCPDFSVAGSRKGMSGDRAKLWFEVVRALRSLRPRFVVLENVDAIRSAAGMAEHPGESALGVVLADLASLGYVGSYVRLGASDVGAPHRRLRWFAVASLADAGRERSDGRVRRRDDRGGRSAGREALPRGEEVARAADITEDRADASSDAGRGGRNGRADVEGGGAAGRGGTRGNDEGTADAGGERRLGREGLAESGDARDGAASVGVEGERSARDGDRPPPDPGDVGRAGPHGRGLAGGRRLAEGARLSSPDAERVARAEAGERDGRPGTGSLEGARGNEGEAEHRASGRARDAAADADGERGEPRGGRRTPGGARARAVEEERDGDGLVGTAEPRTGPISEWCLRGEDVRCFSLWCGCPCHDGEASSDAGGAGLEGERRPADGGPADASSGGRRSERSPERGEVRGGDAPPDPDERRREGLGEPEPRLERALGNEPDGRDEKRQGQDGSAPVEWGPYAPAVARWEAVLGRPAPRPTDDRGRLEPRFVEWMMGFPDGWTEVEGVPRTKRLMVLGNAVQVQVGEVVGYWLSEVARSEALVREGLGVAS